VKPSNPKNNINQELADLKKQLSLEKKKNEMLMHEIEHKRFLLQNINDVVWTFDVEAQKFTYVSDSIEKMQGFTPNEFINSPLERIMPRATMIRMGELVEERVKKYISGIQEENTDEFILLHKDSSEIHVEIKSFIHKNSLSEKLESIGTTRDITDRKKVQLKLEKSNKDLDDAIRSSKQYEQLYKQLFNISKDGMLLYSEKQKLEHVNSSACSIFNLSSQELLEASPEEYFKDEAYPVLLDFFLKVSEGNTFQKYLRITRSDGSTLHLLIYGYKIELGGSDKYCCVVRDISEIHEQTQDLHEREALYASLVDSIPMNVYRVDLEGKLTFANRFLLESLQVNKEDVLGRKAHDFYPKELAEKYENDNLSVIQNRKPLIIQEKNYNTKLKEFRDVEVIKIPILNSEDEVIGIQGIYWDITDRKRAQEELLNEKEFTDFVLDTQIDTFFLFDPYSGKAIRWNKAFREVTGYSNKEIEMLPAPSSYYSEDDLEKAQAFIPEVFEKGKGRIELTLLCKDGNKIPTEYQVTSIYNENNEVKYLLSIGRDITERKRAENELKSSQERYKNFIKLSKEGIFMLEFNKPMLTRLSKQEQIEFMLSHLYIAECNNSFANMYGYAKESELQGQNSKVIFGNEKVARSIYNNFIKNQYEWQNIETNEINQLGETKYFLNNLFSVFENESVVRIWGSQIDITEMKLAERELHETKSLLEAAIGQSSAGIIIADAPDVRIRIANKAAFDIRGESKHLLTGIEVTEHAKHWQTYLPNGKPYPPEQLPLSRAILKGETTYGEEVIIRHESGIDRWVSTNAAPILNNDGEIVSGIVIFQDISARKKSEEALRASEARFKAFMEYTPIFAYIKDENLQHVYTNTTTSKLLGIENAGSADLLFEKKYLDEIEKADKSILSGEKEMVELEVYSSKVIGGMWIKDIKFAITMPTGQRAIGGASFNITELKRIQQELLEHKERLEDIVAERTLELKTSNQEIKNKNIELIRANEELSSKQKQLQKALEELKSTQAQLIESEKMASLGLLMAGVAHEINNPLNFIQSGVSALEVSLEEELKDHAEEIKPMLKGILKGVERVSAIVSSLRHFSRTDDAFHEECNIHAIIDDCLVMLNNTIKNRVEIYKQYTSDEYNLIGSEGKLHQVMLNILSNAIQSIDLKGKVNITTKVEKTNLIILICDTGRGIPDSNINKIFDPFFTTKAPGEGTGLGLSISRKLIHEHKGDIKFSSELGKGTIAEIKLPLKT
jgi:PAS domain S-box-containing protein